MSSSNKKRKHVSSSSSSPDVLPASDCIYTSRIDGGGRRDFYDSVLARVPKHQYDDDFDKVPDKWKIGVGDLIAVRCHPSNAPSKKPLARKSVWYPFTKAWSPGQVIGIYQDFHKERRKGGDDMCMQIRWLYRKQDLIQEGIKVPESDNWRTVYETDAVDEFPIHNVALGRLVLTSMEQNSLQGSYQNKTGMPQMTHVCRHRVNDQDEVVRVLDWDQYNSWNKQYYLPPPLLRGFACPKSHARQDKKLHAACFKAVKERWLAEYVPITPHNLVDLSGDTTPQRASDTKEPAAKENVSEKKQEGKKRKTTVTGVQETASRRVTERSAAVQATKTQKEKTTNKKHERGFPPRYIRSSPRRKNNSSAICVPDQELDETKALGNARKKAPAITILSDNELDSSTGDKKPDSTRRRATENKRTAVSLLSALESETVASGSFKRLTEEIRPEITAKKNTRRRSKADASGEDVVTVVQKRTETELVKVSSNKPAHTTRQSKASGNQENVANSAERVTRRRAAENRGTAVSLSSTLESETVASDSAKRPAEVIKPDITAKKTRNRSKSDASGEKVAIDIQKQTETEVGKVSSNKPTRTTREHKALGNQKNVATKKAPYIAAENKGTAVSLLSSLESETVASYPAKRRVEEPEATAKKTRSRSRSDASGEDMAAAVQTQTETNVVRVSSSKPTRTTRQNKAPAEEKGQADSSNMSRIPTASRVSQKLATLSASNKKRKSSAVEEDHSIGKKSPRRSRRRLEISSKKPTVNFSDITTENENVVSNLDDSGDDRDEAETATTNSKFKRTSVDGSRQERKSTRFKNQPLEFQMSLSEGSHVKSKSKPPAAPSRKQEKSETSATDVQSTSTDPVLHSKRRRGSTSRVFFESTDVQVRCDDIAAEALPRKRATRQSWKLHVGDVVCVECDASNPQSDHVLQRNRRRKQKEAKVWFPFVTGWSFCQVLSIYRDFDWDDGGREVKMEFRWLYRKSDLPGETQRALTFEIDDEREEVFETDHVESEWKMSNVLGRVEVFLGEQDQPCNQRNENGQPGVPTVQCRCRHDVPVEKHGLHVSPRPLKFHRTEPRLVFEGMLERGIKVSSLMRKDKDLKRATSKLLLSTAVRRKANAASHLKTDEERDEDESAPPIFTDNEDVQVLPATKDPGDARVRPTRSGRGRQSSEPSKSTAVEVDNYERIVEEYVQDAGGVEKTAGCSNGASISASHSPQSTSSGQEPDRDEQRVGVRDKDIYHCDVSSLRSYYKEVYVLPPYKNYAPGAVVGGEKTEDDGDKGIEKHWRVKMGDIAVVHWEDVKKSEKYPFNVPWAVGEIVTIWRKHDSENKVRHLQRTLKEDPLGKESPSSSLLYPPCQDSVRVEVRWLYRKFELPGSAPGVNTKKAVDDEWEEVLETDHFDECDALSLLAPVTLHSEAVVGERSEQILGMPMLDYHCRRFWSIHRKALVPTGDMEAMADRGRMYSSHLGRDQVLRTALRNAYGTADNSADTDRWLERDLSSPSTVLAFRDVIKRLSLIDASEATDIRGLRLTGREREQNKIMSFLRSAIRGEGSSEGGTPKDALKKSSLFVAGPPGTGKTASVKSAVERLRHEQATGDIPEFQFVYLNGMEMRHPFEAYIKLWEALSHAKKDKRSPGAAAALLESRFTQGKGVKDDMGRHPVTVLLLDEIDYLVTKKQTVLYNFFDWPIRTATRQKGPRLVVVGISNTLNLPERLKPSVQSRLGGERCDFASYKVDEMAKILKMKITPDATTSNCPVFDEDAIMFAARKTAALSGDVRKALQICKSAAEAVLSEIEFGSREGQPMVGIRDVQRASRESFSSVLSKAVSLSAPFEALLLVSLASLTRTSGRAHGGFDIKEVMTKMEGIAAGSGDLQYMPPPTFDETLEILNRLGEGRLVSLHTPKSSSTTFRAAQGGSGGAWPIVSLPMEDSNVLTALRDSPHSGMAEKYLGRPRAW